MLLYTSGFGIYKIVEATKIVCFAVVMFFFITWTQAEPTVTLVRSVSSYTCSTANEAFLVADEDHTIIEYEISGNDSHYLYGGLSGPQFYIHTSDGSDRGRCSLFTLEDNCTTQEGVRGVCSCEEKSAEVYRLTYIMTALTMYSNITTFIRWAGVSQSVLRLGEHSLPEVRENCPKIKLIKFQSSFDNNEEFLVAGKDYITIQFEVSGNNSVHTFMGGNGPRFYYTTIDGTYEACMGFDPDTGSCINRTGVPDACSCEKQTSSVYRLSYTRTAAVNISKATVYLLWPGKPNLRSDNYELPEVRLPPKLNNTKLQHSEEVGELVGVTIGAGVLVFLAIVAVVGAIALYKFAKSGRTAEQRKNKTEDGLPPHGARPGNENTASSQKTTQSSSATQSSSGTQSTSISLSTSMTLSTPA